jgi:septal ring factor EnvC (AmiA/AmiB activator)
MTISPTILALSDFTAERSSRIDKLLTHLTEKNATLETAQNTMQSAQTKLQEQVELSLERIDSIATKLENQQAILEGIMKSVAAINQQLNQHLAPASSSRKQSASSSSHYAPPDTPVIKSPPTPHHSYDM